MKIKKEGFHPQARQICIKSKAHRFRAVLYGSGMRRSFRHEKKLPYHFPAASKNPASDSIVRKFLTTFAAVNGTLRVFLTAVFAHQLCTGCSKLIIDSVQLLIKVVDCRNAFRN